jgi:hypothetical protein
VLDGLEVLVGGSRLDGARHGVESRGGDRTRGKVDVDPGCEARPEDGGGHRERAVRLARQVVGRHREVAGGPFRDRQRSHHVPVEICQDDVARWSNAPEQLMGREKGSPHGDRRSCPGVDADDERIPMDPAEGLTVAPVDEPVDCRPIGTPDSAQEPHDIGSLHPDRVQVTEGRLDGRHVGFLPTEGGQMPWGGRGTVVGSHHARVRCLLWLYQPETMKSAWSEWNSIGRFGRASIHAANIGSIERSHNAQLSTSSAPSRHGRGGTGVRRRRTTSPLRQQGRTPPPLRASDAGEPCSSRWTGRTGTARAG